VERTGSRPSVRLSGLLTVFSAALLAAGALVATAPAAGAADADLARNGGFEAGLDGWSCTGGSGAAVGAPVPEQVAFGLPASTQAGNGHTSPAEVTRALNCLTKKTDCGGYQTHGTWSGLRGLMTWSINWDRFNNREFSENFDAYFGG